MVQYYVRQPNVLVSALFASLRCRDVAQLIFARNVPRLVRKTQKNVSAAVKECTPGLLKGAAAGLKMGGRLFVYGPFALNGILVPDSNKAFDESLKARSDGVWGIKDAAVVADLADEQGLDLTAMIAMPANNFFVVFTKVRVRRVLLWAHTCRGCAVVLLRS